MWFNLSKRIFIYRLGNIWKIIWGIHQKTGVPFGEGGKTEVFLYFSLYPLLSWSIFFKSNMYNCNNNNNNSNNNVKAMGKVSRCYMVLGQSWFLSSQLHHSEESNPTTGCLCQPPGLPESSNLETRVGNSRFPLPHWNPCERTTGGSPRCGNSFLSSLYWWICEPTQVLKLHRTKHSMRAYTHNMVHIKQGPSKQD